MFGSKQPKKRQTQGVGQFSCQTLGVDMWVGGRDMDDGQFVAVALKVPLVLSVVAVFLKEALLVCVRFSQEGKYRSPRSLRSQTRSCFPL